MQEQLRTTKHSQTGDERNSLTGQDIKAASHLQTAIGDKLTLQQGLTPASAYPPSDPLAAPFFSNEKELVEFHLLRIKVDENGAPRSRGFIRNQRSNSNNFLYFLKLREVSRERHSSSNEPKRAIPSGALNHSFGLDAGFNEIVADYALYLSSSKSEHTINDRISTARALRESYITFKVIRTQSESFDKTLRRLIEISGLSINALAHRSGVSGHAITEWCSGRYIPGPSGLWKVHAVEHALKVPRGTLSTKFPDVYWKSEGDGRDGATAWSEHHRLITKSIYRLKSLTPLLEEEWSELVRSFTDPNWSEETGLPKNSMWRIRWNTNECPTANKNCAIVKSFFGFMRLPTDSADPLLWGMGVGEEYFTLGMMSIYEYVEQFLEFLRGRTLKQLHTESGHGFIHFCISLLRRDTGYIWQHPLFGETLSEPVPREEWHEWCERNRAEMVKLEKRLFGKKKNKDKRKNEPKLSDIGRDPFAEIRDDIESRERPVTLLFELSVKMDEMAPVVRLRGGNKWAAHCRDKFIIDLMPSNPLRCENLAMMTYIPRDWSKFKLACEEYARTGGGGLIYVETDSASNLYQKPDGTFHMRFNPEDFKNEDGAAGYDEDSLDTPYDVPLAEDIAPSVSEYIFKERLVLLEEMKQTIRQVREQRGLQPLTAMEVRRIERCQYVFRPRGYGVIKMKEEDQVNRTGAEQVDGTTISAMFRRRARRLINRNIGAHAGRHIVASDLMKAFPDGELRASVRLHITTRTVVKHYGWVRMADKVRPLNDDLINVRRQWLAGTR